MDIDAIDRKVHELMKFKADAEPMLADWQAHKAKERIDAKRPPPTEKEMAAHAAATLAHARNISHLVVRK